ncbi:MAG: hypothetical protein GC178_15525 [Flavobacteriales bacterium]|nr:hypothetical protein [Flavobacteriales bacterium]
MNFRLLFFVGLMLLLASCTQVQPLEVRTVTCCELKTAVRSEAEIAFDVELYNPNEFPINVKNYRLDVRINGNTIGNSTNKELTIIPAYSKVSKSISVTTSSKELISGSLMMGLGALMGKNPSSLEVEVVGHITGSAKGISKRVRIREKYPIKMHP